MMRVVFENRDADGADDDIHKVVTYYVDFYCVDVYDADVQNVDVIKGVHDDDHDHDDGKLNLMIRLVTPFTSTVMFLMRMFVRMLMLMMTMMMILSPIHLPLQVECE